MNTHRFNGVDINDDDREHALAGLTCHVVNEFGMSCAGYDTAVSLDADEWFDAMAKAWVADGWKSDVTAGREAAEKMADEQGWRKGDRVEIEANMSDELETI